MKTIYLIGTTTDGAARTQSETMASAFEQASGYRRCTREEYYQRMREIRALDLPPDSTEKDRTASNTAGTTPAGTPATPLAGRQQHRQQKEAL